MDHKKKRTGVVLLIGALWIVITVLGWKGLYLPGMILGVALIFLHLILGCSHQGKTNRSFLVFPFGVWAVLWIVSFVLADYYGKSFAGKMPDFTILGLHPSFAWTVLTYWLGGFVVLAVGFAVLKDKWMSDQQWDDFLKKIEKTKGSEV